MIFENKKKLREIAIESMIHATYFDKYFANKTNTDVGTLFSEKIIDKPKKTQRYKFRMRIVINFINFVQYFKSDIFIFLNLISNL